MVQPREISDRYNSAAEILRILLRGAGQVMFQRSAWSGGLFLAGVVLGAVAAGNPAVGAGALLGLASATAAGAVIYGDGEFRDGLDGFNGVLVGCAFPLFLAPNAAMWGALAFCAVQSVFGRRVLNRLLRGTGLNSLTFPFVALTWLVLAAAPRMSALVPAPEPASVSIPDLTAASVAVGWLKGLSEVFLIDSWIAGLLFLAGLAVCSWRSALWGAVGSAAGLSVALLLGASGGDIPAGLYGYSPALTAIALGAVFRRGAALTLAAVVTTVLLQAAMTGLPPLTAPFCVATWFFLLLPAKVAEKTQ
ncbi:MAG: urea transporter [Clostridium sp.]|nr:urea transporter [Clostridium sp.]